MRTLEFFVRKQVVHWENPCKKPIELSRGVVFADFGFDDEWSGLSITVIFTHEILRTSVSVVWAGEPIPVPPEVLHHGWVFVSAVGYGDDGNVRLTTKRMDPPVFVLQAGDIEGAAPKNVTPELWEQILTIIGPLSDLETLDKSSIVAAVNEVYRTGGGGTGGGGMPFDIDNKTLVVENGVLRVNTINDVQQDNTQPITSAAVYTTVGNIGAILDTI